MTEKTGKRLTIAALLAWIVLQLYTGFDITVHSLCTVHYLAKTVALTGLWLLSLAALDALLVGVFRWGIAGAAIATVLSRAAAALGAEMVLGYLRGAACRAVPCRQADPLRRAGLWNHALPSAAAGVLSAGREGTGSAGESRGYDGPGPDGGADCGTFSLAAPTGAPRG